MTGLQETSQASPHVQTPFDRFWREFAESRLALLGLAVLIIVMVIAIAAPLLAPQNPYDLAQLDVLDGKLAPGEQSMGGKTYLLGTDDQGRDMLSGIFYGLRISLSVGVMSTLFALGLGLVFGMLAAYFGGWVDTLIMRIVDIQLSFPSILIALILLAVFGQGVDKVIVALVAVQWAYYARTVRASALVERQKEYVEAATVLALSKPRIVFRHMLPNCLPPLIVVGTVQIANAISLEATLSFLGLGLPPTEPSLGMLIANGFQYMMSGRTWISVYPGIALIVLIVAINIVGDQLRDQFNPRLRR